MGLAVTFLQHIGPRTTPSDEAALETALAGLIEAARRAWPGVDVPTDRFLGYLAERLPPDEDVLLALADIEGADLYLACACASGDVGALAALERSFIARVSVYLARHDPVPNLVDEVKQMLRTRLLVQNGDAAPRITAYTGRGPLGAWLRVSAVRAALDLRRLQPGPTPTSPRDRQSTAPGLDPEMDQVRSRYSDEFREVFHRTLLHLDAREGNVLRLYFLDAMPATAIGRTYGVSGRTVQRWIVDAREKILEETQRLLRERLKVSTTELASLFALVESQVNVSILRLLPRDEPKSG